MLRSLRIRTQGFRMLSTDQFDRQIIPSNQINPIESRRKHWCCACVQKEFVVTKAKTHGPGHGSVYWWSEPSMIPLSYSVIPIQLSYINRKWSTLMLRSRRIAGTDLFGFLEFYFCKSGLVRHCKIVRENYRHLPCVIILPLASFLG